MTRRNTCMLDIVGNNAQRKKPQNILIILTPVDTAGKLWKRWSILKRIGRNLTQPHPTAQIVDNPMEMLRSQKNHNKVCCYQISDDISTVFWFFLSLIITSHSHTQCPITKIGLPYRP